MLSYCLKVGPALMLLIWSSYKFLFDDEGPTHTGLYALVMLGAQLLISVHSILYVLT